MVGPKTGGNQVVLTPSKGDLGFYNYIAKFKDEPDKQIVENELKKLCNKIANCRLNIEKNAIRSHNTSLLLTTLAMLYRCIKGKEMDQIFYENFKLDDIKAKVKKLKSIGFKD